MHRIDICCFVVLALWLPINLFGQAINQERGSPFVTYYPAKEFGAHAQNWAIAQDSKGLMYFGNNSDGVLQFDGVSWRKMHVPNGRVRSLAINEYDQVFVGGYNEFGYLAPDSIGTLEYVSLVSLRKGTQRELEDTERVHLTTRDVFFQARHELLLVIGDSVHVWKPETAFSESFMVDGKLYIRQVNIGLMVFESGGFKLAPGGNFFANEKICSMLPFDDKHLIVATSNNLFLYDHLHVSPFRTNADQVLTEITDGVLLPDNTFAYGTTASGIVIVGRTGEIRRIIDRTSGLNTDTVYRLYVDRHDALWATLGSGIARIKYPAAITLYADETAPIDIVDATRHKGVLYVTNTSGLFRLKSQTLAKNGKQTPLRYADFEPVLRQPMLCRSLLTFGSDLLVGAARGIFAINGQNVRLIINNPLSKYVLHRSKQDSNRVFVGMNGGLGSFHQTPGQPGVWHDDGIVNDVTGFIRTLFEDDDGKLWVGSDFNGIRRIDFSKGFTKTPSVQFFGEDNGLPTGQNMYDIQVFPVQGKPLFATARGHFRFDQTTGKFRREPNFESAKLNDIYRAWAYTDDSQGNFILALDGPIESPFALLKSTPGGMHNLIRFPFRILTQPPRDFIFLDADGSVWLATDEALINYDPAKERKSAPDFSTLIRKVVTLEDSVVFGGTYATKPNIPDKSDINSSPVLTYQNNSLRFELAATSYDNAASNHYQFFLQGIENTWSKWSLETRKDYTHLPPGNYIFRVRGQNVYGVISGEATYAFKILPPWYRTWFAYLVYLFLFIAGIFGLVKTQVRRAQRIERAKSEQREQIRKEMVADFHDGAGDKLAQISLFSKFVQSKITDNSQETLNALKWTIEAADALKLETRDFIWALDTGHDSLWDVADRIVSHGKNLFQRTQPEIAFKAHGLTAELQAVTLPLDWKRNLIFIFKEGLNNALKYAKGTQVEIHFRVEGGIIIIRLSDNGIGFNPASGFDSKGLKNMRRRAEKLGAEVVIDSQPEAGTTIHFKGKLAGQTA